MYTMNHSKLIKELQVIFPYDKMYMCEDKYKETVSDYLHEVIINKLNK